MVEQLITITALLWAGMILAISFLESWVKFRTPTLTKHVGIDVGRTVFCAFHKTQYGLIIILIILSLIDQFLLWNWLIIAATVLILALQGLWLFPYLSRFVDMILMEKEPPKSYVHLTYGILEIIKLVLLLCFAFVLMTVRFGL